MKLSLHQVVVGLVAVAAIECACVPIGFYYGGQEAWTKGAFESRQEEGDVWLLLSDGFSNGFREA